MNSPAEERLRRMLEEGKITPQQFEELRAAVADAQTGKSAPGTASGEAAVDWDRMTKAYLDGQRSSYRKWMMILSIAIWGMGVVVGLVVDEPLLWGIGLLGLILDAYRIRSGKLKNSIRSGRMKHTQ
jgi:hypothetical protein